MYVVAKQSLTEKLARWMLLLQEFEFEIQRRPGTQHAVADDIVAGHDDFSDAEILHITTDKAKDGKHYPNR